MIWEYNISTHTIWTSFDYGEVEADNYEEAKEKALKQLNYDLEKCNASLAHCDVTAGFKVEMDLTQLQINLKNGTGNN